MKQTTQAMTTTIILLSLALIFTNTAKADLVYQDNFNNYSFATPWEGANDGDNEPCAVIGNQTPLYDGPYMYCNRSDSRRFFTTPTGTNYTIWRLEFELYDPDDDDLLGNTFGCGIGTGILHMSGISMKTYSEGTGANYTMKTDYTDWEQFTNNNERDTGWHHITLISNGTHVNFTILQDNTKRATSVLPLVRDCYSIIGWQDSHETPIRIDNIKLYNDTETPINNNEAEYRTAIEQAINTTIPNRTLYTDKQIYGRNQTNNQILGTFDKFATLANKRWAINYLTGTDTYTYLFNLTPALYVYEATGKTPTQVRTEVETLINATK